jgi:hypothetical protein
MHLETNKIADDDYPGHSGWYCGNREQFVKRHKKAVVLMRSLLMQNTGVSIPGGEPGYAPRECSAMSADTALAIADGVETGDLREAARVLSRNAQWYKNEYERLRKAYAHDVRQNGKDQAR